MKLLFAFSEVAPFSKTGGLADVGSALPTALAARGHDVKVVLPLYESVEPKWRQDMTFVKSFYLKLAWRTSYCGILSLRHQGVDYWFVDNEYYFKRPGIYGHFDDGERFAFFSRAVLETAAQLDWRPDILHANDWQTALAPVYLLEEKGGGRFLSETKSVFTIHNMEYQGRYGAQNIQDLFGLNPGYLNDDMLGYYGEINLLKGGMMAADAVTTVSPTYAQEIRDPFFAHGLEGTVARCAGKLRGVLNGIDTARYDPAGDPALAAPFSADDPSGKALCKAALQKQLGLAPDPDAPVVGCVSRLVRHKGFDLVVEALESLVEAGLQFAVLGSGDGYYEDIFRAAATRWPGRFAVYLGYSDQVASVIYGGADLFLMPSLSEPCGLSQMIAMRYGTLPVVRETGGLKDTVFAYRPDTGEGNGFSFANISAHDMAWVVRSAAQLYRFHPQDWGALRRRAMRGDYSWNKSAGEYEDIYRGLTAR